MNKTALGLAFAFAVATALLQSAQADPWYTVNAHGTVIMQYTTGGKVRCVVKGGTPVHRDWGENWSEKIYVRVKSFPDNWNCHGWIDKLFLTPHVNTSEYWYEVVNRNGALMKTEPGGGSVKCHIPYGKFLIRNNQASANNDKWIYLQWKDRWKAGNADANWDANGKKCLDWDQHGWMLKSDLRTVNRSQVLIDY